MEHGRWRIARGIFEQAVELDAHARAELVARACGTDAELRAEVESLLASAQASDRFDSPDADALRALSEAALRLGAGVIGADAAGDGAAAAEPAAADPARNDEFGGSGERQDRRVSFEVADVLARKLAAGAARTSRYQRLGEIAHGAMGTILRVWDRDFGRELAMKVSSDPSSFVGATRNDGSEPPAESLRVQCFVDEAQVTGRLNHPGIVPVHDFGVDGEGRPYFTMRLVDGRDLKAIFGLVFAGADGWNETRALGALLKVCEAMAYAHENGVIHRDLKPANVMVGNYGEVYVMDWGIAHVVGEADRHDLRVQLDEHKARVARSRARGASPDATHASPIVTMGGDVVGTPCYMSPEQARGDDAQLSARSDVYAIGSMLYHLLARQMPYVPSQANAHPFTVLMKLRNGPPTPLHRIRADVPGELVAICEKAMAREPAQRYAHTLELADDLRAYLEQRVVRAYEAGTWAETRKWIQRNKRFAGSLACAAAAICVGSLGMFVKTKEAAAAQQLASTKEVEAQQRARDVLSLSDQRDLDELLQAADALWPASPAMIREYEDWLARMRELFDGRAADEVHSIRGHLGLAQHRAKLAELRARARVLDPAERAAARARHPDAQKLEQLRAELLWRERMAGLAAWPNLDVVCSDIERQGIPNVFVEYRDRCRRITGPQGPTYGREIEALLLAEAALAAAADDSVQRSQAFEALAWSHLWLGRGDEAIEFARRGVALTPESRQWKVEILIDDMEREALRWTGADALQQRHYDRERLARDIAQLDGKIEYDCAVAFEDAGSRWWYAGLSELEADLTAASDPDNGVISRALDATFDRGAGQRVESGWGIERRLEFARSIEQRSVSGDDALRRWHDAIEAIAASPHYGGLRIRPQLGLLPLGPDPASGLWEFAHLASGDAPSRASDGTLTRDERTCVVLVLIPGARTRIGAQSKDSAQPHYDPNAQENELVSEVELEPYFLSKYELTYGQWIQMGGNDSSARARRVHEPRMNREFKDWNLSYPLAMVSWNECELVLRRMELALPTEAQWEHACRAGTATPYSFDGATARLERFGNVADQFFWSSETATTEQPREPWDDGYRMDAEVGSYEPNAFGLHDMHGNVMEWCRDAFGLSTVFTSGSGERYVTGSPYRVLRGGSFFVNARFARSSYRHFNAPDTRYSGTGVRPSRALAP